MSFLKQMNRIDAILLTSVFTVTIQDIGFVDWEPNEIDVGLSLRNLERLGLIKVSDIKEESFRELSFFATVQDEKIRGKLERKFVFHVKITTLGFHFLHHINEDFSWKHKDSGAEYFPFDWKPSE